MRVTDRCNDLFRLLRTARWLTTGQIHERFFAPATVDATRKRLRKLVAHHYLIVRRTHRMDQSWFALGRAGKQALQNAGVEEVSLERRVPTQVEHFRGINDCRILAELAGCGYFFACWELPGVGWRERLIPDAIFTIQNQLFAVEYDRGMEGAEFFARTKIPSYERGFAGFPCRGLIVLTDSQQRMVVLDRAIGTTTIDIRYSTVQMMRERGLGQPIFHRYPSLQTVPETLLSASLADKRPFDAQSPDTTKVEMDSGLAIKEHQLDGGL